MFTLNKLASRSAIVVGASLLVFFLVFVSFSPISPPAKRPSAQDVQAARQLWRQLNLAQNKAPTEVRADNQILSGLSALARDATGVDTIDATLSEGKLRIRASMSLPLGLWVNVSATATGNHNGFPPFRAKVGRLDLPTAVGRPLANLARTILRMRGTEIPPLDQVVQSFSIERSHIVAKLRLRSKTGMVDQMIAASGPAVRRVLVEAFFCRIAARQREEPVQRLSALVSRTFAGGPRDRPDEYNRAAFVAVSLAVVGDKAEALIPRGGELRKKCTFHELPLRLHGRVDLAKHWALSAALTSVVGAQAAKNLGEWKELDDSLPDGSGFSFVDLAANRAGIRTALLALDRHTAAAIRKKLGQATDNDLLPEALLEAPEGLSDATFVQRFGSLDRQNYEEAIARIDEILARHKR